MNAIMYILKTGCQWRMLPKDFTPHNTVFYYFNKWKLEGVFEELMDTLHRMVRKLMGREETPSLGIIDSRSAKSSHHVDADRGIDGNKKIKGRKEHIVVDTLGLPMSVVAHEANVHDSIGAELTVILRPDESSKKFSVLPLRWIVERSFSWLENFRRIAMDYEFYSDSGETMVQLAFCRLMYNKLCD